MATAARKARKAAGIKFTRTPKVGTPLTERAWFNALIPGVPGTRHQLELVRRSEKKRDAAIAARSVKEVDR